MVSWLAYFIMSGCDSLVVGRTIPTQSWTNPVERVMFILNLALSNCALARDLMDDDFEKKMKKCNSMSSVRKHAATLDSAVALVVAVVASLEMVDAPPSTILATTLVHGDAPTSVPLAHDTHVVISGIVTEAITTSATTFGATTTTTCIVDIVTTDVYYSVDGFIAFCCYLSS